MKRLFKHRILISDKGVLHLSESLALRAVSLLLGLILWITILGLKREDIKLSVKLEPLLPPGMVIANNIPQSIQFTLSGPRIYLKDAERRIQPIRPDLRKTRDLTVVLSISEDLVGELPAGVRVAAFYPTQVLIRLEEIIEKQIQVKPILHGAPHSGYEVVSYRAEPKTVLVAGPKGVLQNLDYVTTEPIEISDVTNGTTLESAIEVETARGFQLVRESDRVVKVIIKTNRVH